MFKSLTSVQDEPSHDSVFAVTLGLGLTLPPYTKAAVVVPEEPGLYPLAKFKSLISVQEVPFHFSTAAVKLPASPPAIAREAV